MVSDHVHIILCSVLSLRDSCVMYPSCPHCVSRLQNKLSGLRCQKCGFTSKEQSITYRYRLSLNVKRYSDIFGVTVFGSCLNPYFGIPAVGLQRFCEESQKNAEDPQSDCVHRLLIKAVEDSFVGRQFEFGIKLPGRETGERTFFSEQGLPALLDCNGISRGFVANQIILPNGAAGGSSVLSYFKKLLQASCVVHLCGLPTPERPPGSPERIDSLALKSFECSLPSFSRTPLSHSHDVRYLKQSPGIITSSAEQEQSEIEPNRTNVGSQWWCRKAQRCPQKCSHGTPPYVLSPQYCSLDVDREVRCNDSSQARGLGFLACHDSRETAESSPSNSIQCSLSSLPDTPELTSSVTESGNHKSPKPSKIEQVELEQNEGPGVKLGWRGVFSEGKDDMSSFQEGLSVCGWNSKLSNSSAWEDLPFSESWGEFISKANRLSAVSEKDNVCDSAKKIEAEISKAGCVDEMHKHANCHQANGSSATECTRNVIILSEGTTSYLHGRSAHVKEEDSTAMVQQPFIKSSAVCCTENSNLSANDLNVKQKKMFRAHMSTSDQLVHASEDQERGKGDLSLLVPGLRGLTSQGQENVLHPDILDFPLSHCNDYVQNKIKEFSCVGSETKKWGTVYHSNYCISEHKLNGQGTSVWDFGREEQALPNRELFCAKDVYNASADLFGSCQNSFSIVEEEDKRVTPQSEHKVFKLLKSCHPLVDANRGDHSTPIDETEKPSTNKCMLGSDISDPLDFVPFSQSTPISGNLDPRCLLPRRGKEQTPGRLKGNVSWHHGYSKTDSKSKKENVRDRSSEDTVPLSMGIITHSSKPQSLTRSLKRLEPVDGYHCKRILLTSRVKNSHRKILSSRIDNICENTKATVFVPSCPKLEDCVKSAHLGSDRQKMTEVVTSSECAASKNDSPLDTSTSCLCTDRDGMDLDWSADLFTGSFGI